VLEDGARTEASLSGRGEQVVEARRGGVEARPILTQPKSAQSTWAASPATQLMRTKTWRRVGRSGRTRASTSDPGEDPEPEVPVP